MQPNTSKSPKPPAVDLEETRPAELGDVAAPSRSLEHWRQSCASGLLALASEMTPEEARGLVLEISQDAELRSRSPQQVAMAAYQLLRQDGKFAGALQLRDIQTQL